MRPHRAPIFGDLYPAAEFYEALRRDFEAMLAPVTPGLPPINPAGIAPPKVMPRELFPPCNLPHAPLRIVPEATGRITRVLVTVPKFLDKHDKPLMFRYERYPRHFKRLFAAVGPKVDWVIVSGDREWRFVKQWLAAARIPNRRVTRVNSPQFNYSIWAQDPFLALTDGAFDILCEGVLFNREHDMTIADDVDYQVANIVATQSYLFFQGGNLLGGTATSLIGADYVVRNTKRFGIETEERVLEFFRKLTGTEVLRLGGTKSGDYEWHRDGIFTGHGFQPIFHIDMFVTPSGVTNDEGREIVFLSRPRAAFDVVGKWSEVHYLDNERIDQFFEETSQQLARKYDVRELPLLSTRGDLGGNEEFVRYYFLTWSNALVEVTQKKRHVILPSFVEDARRFGLDPDVRRALQKHVEKTWATLGFDVTVIDGLEDLVWGDGSIHCIAKVLARSSRADG